MEQTIRWEMCTPQQIVTILDNMHRSKAFICIRDEISRDKLIEIKQSDQYQLFQDIKEEAKKSYVHDRTMASNADVDRACTTLYGLMLKIIKTQGNAYIEELHEIHQAINKIEEHVGLEVTKWSIDADGTENTDVESSADNI